MFRFEFYSDNATLRQHEAIEPQAVVTISAANHQKNEQVKSKLVSFFFKRGTDEEQNQTLI